VARNDDDDDAMAAGNDDDDAIAAGNDDAIKNIR
jgi:hypothetical protein